MLGQKGARNSNNNSGMDLKLKYKATKGKEIPEIKIHSISKYIVIVKWY